MSEELNFDDITPQSIPVSIAGKKYVLREPTAEAECKYRSAMMRGTRFSQDGKQATAEGNAEAELLLISLCLFELYEQGGQTKERPVHIATVRGWLARVHKALFEKANAMRPKDEEDETALEKRLAETQRRLAEIRNGNGDHAGNLPSATADTSASA